MKSKRPMTTPKERMSEERLVLMMCAALDVVASGRQTLSAEIAGDIRDLLTRLSAAKAEAERERDEAREEKLRAVQAANATGEFALELDKRRLAAEAALAKARADALEEAAAAMSSQSDDNAFYEPLFEELCLVSSDEWTPENMDAMACKLLDGFAAKLRVLKTTPTQESETP